MGSRSVLCSFVAAATLLAGTAAVSRAADTLFSNLNAGNSSEGSSTIIGGSTNFFNSTVGADFTVTGSDAALETIDLVVGGFSMDPNAVSVTLRADAAGAPGAALETLTYSGNFGDRSTISLSSLTHPLLSVGSTYWLTVTSATPDKAILWANNSTGDDRNGLIDYGSDGSYDPSADVNPAFRITGTVPEPAALLGAALGATLLRRRRLG